MLAGYKSSADYAPSGALLAEATLRAAIRNLEGENILCRSGEVLLPQFGNWQLTQLVGTLAYEELKKNRGLT